VCVEHRDCELAPHKRAQSCNNCAHGSVTVRHVVWFVLNIVGLAWDSDVVF